MDKMGNELIKAARYELGRPFRHHFKPENLCDDGRITIDQCMERGMDGEGYDCMGLVIASICNVLGVSAHDWPREYRHSLQMHVLATDKLPDFGDVLLIESKSKGGYQLVTHMGLYIEYGRVLHANGKTKVVDESEVAGIVTDIKAVDMKALADLALTGHCYALNP